MKLTIPHPVFAPAKVRKSGEARIAVGIVKTEFEVPEYSRRDAVRAFQGKFLKAIEQVDGKLWRRSDVNLTGIEKDGLLSPYIDGDRQTSCILTDYVAELDRMTREDRDLLMPKPALALRRDNGSVGEAVNYLRKVGDFERRDVVHIDEEAVESWRNRMREFVAGFALIDGTPYERAHEPMLFVHGYTVTQGSSSIFRHHANRVTRNELGLAKGDLDAGRSNIHVFSIADSAAAVELADEVSGKPDGGRANWFDVECLIPPTSAETVLEMEACRFTALHLANFEAVSGRWKDRMGEERHSQLISDPSTPLGACALAAREAQAAVASHQFGEPDFGRVREALDGLALMAAQTDQAIRNDQDLYNWEMLSENTVRHQARLDIFPINLHVAPAWRL
jgi:hypothetical protein|nr:hypothetical protein [Neorhizobium tomejilense]